MKRLIKYQAIPIREKRNDAFAKAPGDVVLILSNIGYEPILLDRIPPANKCIAKLQWFVWAMMVGFKLFKMPRKSLILFQLPSVLYDKKIHPLLKVARKFRGLRYVAFFHDLGEIQHKGSEKLNKGTSSIIKLSDAIIIHNSHMARWLEVHGVEPSKMVELKLFDYLHNCRVTQPIDKNGAIIIAGRLSVKKCAYLKQLEAVDGVRFNLYGICD